MRKRVVVKWLHIVITVLLFCPCDHMQAFLCPLRHTCDHIQAPQASQASLCPLRHTAPFSPDTCDSLLLDF